MESKRLYRSLTDRKLAGVAGGLAEYFVMDPLLIRLAFVILTLAGGGGVLIYIVLWIVTPENPAGMNPQYNQQEQRQQPSSAGNPAAAPETATDQPGPPPPDHAAAPQVPQTKERKKGSLIGGLVLITLGALFLADELIPHLDFGDLWPVIIIVIGVGLLINAVTKRNREINP
jgi:phage shock protein PspC (stress-responsive transcriptional regulator)